MKYSKQDLFYTYHIQSVQALLSNACRTANGFQERLETIPILLALYYLLIKLTFQDMALYIFIIPTSVLMQINIYQWKHDSSTPFLSTILLYNSIPNAFKKLNINKFKLRQFFFMTMSTEVVINFRT